MKRGIFLLSLIILCTTIVRADESVRFSASAPSTVVMDKPFQLVYSVNASGRDLRVPEINHFEILAGPFESHSSSIQIINGRRSSSEEVSFTYTLLPKKTGTFSIAPASIVVSGKKYTSNGLSIKVLQSDASGKSQRGEQASGGSPAVSGVNCFIRASVSKSSVYEQEAVLVTYKLYTTLDVIQCANKKMPDFNGFLKQEIEQSQDKQYSYESYNGKNYGTVVLYKVLLYPQRSGVIEISKANFEAVIRIENRAKVRSIFDDFFDSYTNVSKNIIAPAVKVVVKPLPANKPASFNGAVGHFTMNTSISNTRLKTNEAATLKIQLSGTGNLKLMKAPEIKFPQSFETYDPKQTNNFKNSSSGVAGTKTIEYTFIPRHSGTFEIPSAEFSYFDTQTHSYKVLSTSPYKLTIAKGEGGDGPVALGNYVNKEDVKQLGKDIRYIVTDDFDIVNTEEPIFGSMLCWLMFLVPLLIALVLFVFFRKQAVENANVSLVKNKKANKVAQKRLKLAQKLLKEGEKDKFYEEVMKAVWTYLSDKLTIPAASLTKENVESELTARKVDAVVINKFIQILNTCEFARYAPNSGQQEMGNLYDETMQAISELEELYKKL